MDFCNCNIGFALTGSFCTISSVIPRIEDLVRFGANVTPIMSEMTYSTDTRFGRASDFIDTIEEICNKKIICSINAAEPIGPKNLLDALIIAPCTGNTLSKLANGVNDTCVTMAAKASLRNKKPIIIGISTNDGLGVCAKNIGLLLNSKNIYFVPFSQDDPIQKSNSVVAKMELITPTLINALQGEQIQPILV